VVNSATVELSVIIPVYNEEQTIEEVVQRVLAVDLGSIESEVIIVDDGSSDGTRQAIERWAQEARFPIRYFWQPNSGKHIAYNRAIAEARGEFFTLLDSDDACELHALARLLALQLLARQAVLVGDGDADFRIRGVALLRP